MLHIPTGGFSRMSVDRSARQAELRLSRRGVWLLVAALVSGCGLGTAEPPGPDFDRGAVPDLRGSRVLVLPPQVVQGGHADLERELVFALREGSAGVEWVDPDELRDRMARSPELRFTLDQLDVHPFRQGAVDRIGDPLYGHLYQLGAVESADLALLPVEVRERSGSDGDATDLVRIEVLSALIQIRTGRVLWSGVTGGDPGPAGALAPTASAMDALARRLGR